MIRKIPRFRLQDNPADGDGKSVMTNSLKETLLIFLILSVYCIILPYNPRLDAFAYTDSCVASFIKRIENTERGKISLFILFSTIMARGRCVILCLPCR